MTIKTTCRECNEPFSISQDEISWLNKKGLALFTRCGECRAKRRAKRNADAECSRPV